MSQLPELAVIVGPTAVGKTSAAIRLAGMLGGEIVSADSRYFYRGMDIGTAKPSPAELAQIPHHLIDVTTPDQPWSLADFQQQARAAIDKICSRGRLPILVGGTGQYIRAITHAWQVPPVPPDPALRLALEAWGRQIGPRELHARLRLLDPAAAARMDAGNLRRVVRAMEVIFTTGKRFSEQSIQSPQAYAVFMAGLTRPRPELYARIDARIGAMFSAGLVDEVKGLLEAGYAPDLPAMSAIGYREMTAYLQGQSSLEECLMLVKRNTRKFVRRQANWFKAKDPSICWYAMEPDPVEAIAGDILRWRQGNAAGAPS